jgi:hypothetical protein
MVPQRSQQITAGILLHVGALAHSETIEGMECYSPSMMKVPVVWGSQDG